MRFVIETIRRNERGHLHVSLGSDADEIVESVVVLETYL